MKKYLIFLLCISLIIITGCGKDNKLVCSKTTKQGDKTISLELVYDLDKDDIAKEASMVYDFGDEELAKNFCSAYKQKGKDSKISCSGSRITVSGLGILDNESSESNSMIGKTKDEIISMAFTDGFICE